jgi:hypothetical protein
VTTDENYSRRQIYSALRTLTETGAILPSQDGWIIRSHETWTEKVMGVCRVRALADAPVLPRQARTRVTVLEHELKEIEDFVMRRLVDIHGLLTGDVQRAKSELAKHCTEITLTPEGQTYQISGDWNLLGGRSDGAGGQNRTGYARLFRAALYQ